ncbi:RNA polymerase sigma-70 factor, ECF subfamily [Filimonas lacunae]|uniref:RNA polymerase sigma-70 factor, ECF subfamily n=1 Tax=Filimonas lacunae TaxID=477680 RepID=A0A173MQN7_9BACT|nr:RNA polymerase sigma-70 factor [Filimonas lacunae]BAV09806.1 RNA polymerase sigma-24 factor, ECF subfamily [Filimonas lacunae]SIS79221.1 RNA polymerase sigma-70 factor, ECF subfamily [Filimonas lacunae]
MQPTLDISYSGLMRLLLAGDEQVFEQVFKTHFKSLHAYAFTILNSEAVAEEMVQQVFYKLWERKETVEVHTSLKAYLYRAVHNESINYLKHHTIKIKHQTYAMQQQQHQQEQSAGEKLAGKELEQQIRQALNELPEQCRTIFQLSRYEELKYKEIADQLGLSIKTIESQMGKALKLLRVKLADFLVLIISLLLYR